MYIDRFQWSLGPTMSFFSVLYACLDTSCVETGCGAMLSLSVVTHHSLGSPDRIQWS